MQIDQAALQQKTREWLERKAALEAAQVVAREARSAENNARTCELRAEAEEKNAWAELCKAAGHEPIARQRVG